MDSNRISKSGMLCIAVLSLISQPIFAAASRNFLFTIPYAGRVSGGVFDQSGALVKTLFSGRTYPPGTYVINWDGNCDNHYGVVSPAAPGVYTFKAVVNNVRYTWDGVIGNTSSSMLGENVWKGQYPITDMAFNSSGVGVGQILFNEGQPNLKRFVTTDPESPTNVMSDGSLSFPCVAVDGKRIYTALASSGWDTYNSSFVLAYNLSDNSLYNFPTGVAVTAARSSYASAIDISQRIGTPMPKAPGSPDSDPSQEIGDANSVDGGQAGGTSATDDAAQELSGAPVFDKAFVDRHMATGLAVQQHGDILAVAHGGLNLIKLFNKNTGAFLNQFAISKPGRLAFTSSGDLWVLTGNILSRFAADTLGTTVTPVSTITGLTNVLTFATDPTDDNKVLVMDGESMQVKCYRFGRSWTLLWALGQAGGYSTANGPDVTTDKFWFARNSNVLACQSDGSFWVADGGNFRLLHFARDRTYLGQIAYSPILYTMCIDATDPTRIFTGMTGLLEYKIDYSKRLMGGDPGLTGAWRLVKNWNTGLDQAVYGAGGSQLGFQCVTTLGGHTYAELAGLSGVRRIVELPANGAARFIGKDLTGDPTYLSGNGDLVFPQQKGSTYLATRIPGSGFETGNPTWTATPEVLFSVPVPDKWANDPLSLFGYLAFTSTHKIISFNRFAGDSTVPGSYHLGAIELHGTKWLWRAAPGKWCDGSETDGSFGLEAFGGLNGIRAFADGRNVIYGFNGQYVAYSNKYLHYYDNGLYIGQCGVNGDSSLPGTEGNVMRMDVAHVGKTMYIYTSDESGHGGASRFSVTGLDTIKELTGELTSLPVNPSDLVAQPISSTQVRLAWNENSGDQTDFVVERATDSTFTDNLKTVAVTAANVLSFTDSVSSTIPTFFYRVAAKSVAGNSGYAATATYRNIVWDTFSAADGTAMIGRVPADADRPGGGYAAVGLWKMRIQGGAASLNSDVGACISIASKAAYTKPPEFTISAMLNPQAIKGTDSARGMGLGFYSAPAAAHGHTNFSGLALNPDGALRLFTNDRDSGQSASYTGTWTENQPHFLTYHVNTRTGEVSHVELDGQMKTFTTTSFTDAATAYAGFYANDADAIDGWGLVRDFKVTGAVVPIDTGTPSR